MIAPEYADLSRWPSIQRDSEILRKRIAPALRVAILRRVLHSYLDVSRAA